MVEKYTYLGVEINGKGNLKDFMERIGRKIDKNRWQMNTLRKVGGENIKRNLFQIYCEPLLRMGATTICRLGKQEADEYVRFCRVKMKEYMSWPKWTEKRVMEKIFGMTERWLIETAERTERKANRYTGEASWLEN